MWVARRSGGKPVDPGKLDNIVGGGVAAGLDVPGTLVKECGEEAGLPPSLSKHASPAGVLQVRHAVPEGLHNEHLFVFDLQLNEDFRPVNRDGEVAEFILMDAPELRRRLVAGEFTVDAATVAIDFLWRIGEIDDQNAIGDLMADLRRS